MPVGVACPSFLVLRSPEEYTALCETCTHVLFSSSTAPHGISACDKHSKILLCILGILITAAHHTFVRVITDLEYRAGKYALQEELWGLVLVGGPNHNKVSATLLTSARPTQASWLQSELIRYSSGHSRVLYSRNISAAQVSAPMPRRCETRKS